MDSAHDSSTTWSSPRAFVVTAAGAVIGLGNIWRLPQLAGDYGGGAFIIVYVLALVAMALPLLVAQLALGRGRRADLVAMIGAWAASHGLSRWWRWLGGLALVGAALVLSYTSVIAGWSMAYLVRSAAGALAALPAQGLHQEFVTLVGDPERGLGWHTMFMVAVALAVAHGVRRGLEPVARWLLAVAFLALVALVVAAALGEGAAPAAALFWRMDFAALGWRGAFEALHQAFFSLSLGVGVMLAFGVYLRDDTPLLPAALAVVALDALFACAAGFAVSALVFAAGATPSAGLALVFEAMPAAVGAPTAALFYLMVLLVALTSATALMEPVVVWAMRAYRTDRLTASTGAGLVIWFMGLGTLLSFNLLAEATLLGRTVFDWLALISADILLPLVGLLLCLFAGRFIPAPALARAWGDTGWGFRSLRWLLRYPARIGLILVLLYALGAVTLVVNFWNL